MRSFGELFEELDWQPIRNCPGRYVLRGTGSDLNPAAILGHESITSEHKVRAARDMVLVTKMEGGGLISYRRADGTFVHTLNTTEGFERKLLELGIEL